MALEPHVVPHSPSSPTVLFTFFSRSFLAGLATGRRSNANVAVGWVVQLPAVVLEIRADGIDEPALRGFLDVQRLAGKRIGDRLGRQAKLRELRHLVAPRRHMRLQGIEHPQTANLGLRV